MRDAHVGLGYCKYYVSVIFFFLILFGSVMCNGYENIILWHTRTRYLEHVSTMRNIMQIDKCVFLGGMFGFLLQAKYEGMGIKLEPVCVM